MISQAPRQLGLTRGSNLLTVLLLAILVLVGGHGSNGRAGEALPWPDPAPTLGLPVALDRIYSASDGRLVGISRSDSALVVIDALNLVAFDPVPVAPGPTHVAVSPNPYFEEYAVLSQGDEVRLTFVAGSDGDYQPQALDADGISQDFSAPDISYVNLPQTRAFESGPTLTVSDLQTFGGAGYYRLFYPNSFEFVKPSVAPFKLIEIGAAETVLTLLPQDEQAALLDLRNGFVTDGIWIDGLSFKDPNDVAVAPLAADSGELGLTLVANADQGVLTVLSLREGRTPRLSAPLQISFDPFILGGGSGERRMLVVSDRELTQIAIGAEGQDTLQVFRRIRGGLEFLETVELDAPIRDLAVLNLAGSAGPQAFAFLSADGRSLTLRGIGSYPRRDGALGPDRGLNGEVPLTSSEIARIQSQLRALNYDIGVDGVLGPQSRTVLAAFQQSIGLEGTGQPDVQTMRELSLATSGGSLEPDVFTIDPDNVLQIQRLLASLNYRVGAIDGETGNLTRAALRAFQSDNGLPVTGRADQETVSALAASVSSLNATEDIRKELDAYSRFIADRGGRVEAPERLLTLGVSQENPGHECFGLNYQPPAKFWENSVRLAHTLGLLEREMGVPLQVVSGYRSPAYERCIGEPGTSRHEIFADFDLRVAGARGAADSADLILPALDRLVAAGVTTADARAIGSLVHIEPRLGRWQTVVASHQLDDLGCSFAKSQVDEISRLLADSPASGRLAQVIRTSGGGGDVFAVTIDLHSDEAAAGQVRSLVREAAARTKDRKTGEDSFVMERRTARLDPNCLRQRIIP